MQPAGGSRERQFPSDSSAEQEAHEGAVSEQSSSFLLLVSRKAADLRMRDSATPKPS